MPIYEYRCSKCRRKTAVFVRGFGAHEAPCCEHCGNAETARVFSTFTVGKGQSNDLSSMADDMSMMGSAMGSGDPRAVAGMLRKANEGRGPDPELDEIVGRMEQGEAPDDLYGALRGEGFHGQDDGGATEATDGGATA